MKSENFKLVLIFLSAFITFVSCSPSSHKKEFTFHGQSYTKLINIHGGDNLVIGSKPTQTVAKSDMKYICTKFRYDQISYERSDYKTVVKKAGIDDDSYFVLITRAVWQCKEDVARIANSQLSNFVRVENDLISIKPIAAVEFCDGVFVSATRYIGQRYAVKIKEIKYLKSTSTDPNKYETAPMNVVQYDGLIALEEAPFPPYQPRVPSKQLTHFEADVPQPVYGECSHDIPNNKEAMQFTLSTNSGRAFAIGTKQKGDLESPPPGSSCPECFTINPGTPYHSLYRTEVIEILESGFEGIMNDEEFSKVFVIASRTVHVCHSPDKPEAEFIRVEQRVIGLAAIKYLRLYSHTITQMTAIEMDANSATMSAMFTEVKYIQADGSALKQLKVPRRKLFIEEEVSTHIGKAIDIAYLIKSTDVVSRTLISDEGYDLRIGEPTRVAKMNNEGTVDCQEYAISKMVSDETSNHMWLTETKVFMKVNGDNTFHTLKQIAEDRQKETFGKPFYELVQRKTWKCIIEPAPKEKFIRVESRIRVLVPVRELESYDGVKIFKTRSENGEWSVEIVEVRHLSNEYPHDSIRLSASINTFNEINDPSDIMKYSSDNEPSLLKKSGDEMVHTMGAGAKKGLNVRGTRSNDADSQTIIKNIGPGRHSIKFNLGVFSHIGNAEDIADCDVLQTGSYSSDKILPAFTIIDAQQNGKAILTSGTKAVHDSVFKDLSAEIWKCTIRGVVQENTQFLRVVYDHTLKTNPEYDIGTVEHLQRDEVWLEVEDGQPVVRVRETKYLDIVNNYRVINYIGLHLLTPKLISSEWKSGTQIIENYQSISDTVINRELMGAMQYFDDLPHSLSIEAYDTITIDTRWTKTFGNAEMTLRCEKDSTGRFTSLKTKMTVDNDNKNISAYFINEISTEFWICSDQTNENGIVRVHHQFSLNNWWSIKEIRYFYGVTIFGGNTATISRTKRSGKKHSFTPYEYEIIVIRYHENGANYPIVKYD
ncbi:uncharacterized protein LOC111053501 isoform X2 [Nilaparvata lugens]|uniref:uncharacterized protein LOC111053501 isoform X2 n=1 Tax=Nilaparvata lugens TaxID=108931 RepID=UPI00193E08B9|nr:uncharacterized protein LOC111053501 isoform X2 [Nilaparvata lugens]